MGLEDRLASAEGDTMNPRHATVTAVVFLIGLLFAPLQADRMDTTSIVVGSSPMALCYNSVDNRICCAKGHDSTLTVIDGATNRVIATVALSGGPCYHYFTQELCYNSTNNKVYCTSNAGVSVIDGESDREVAVVPVGGSPIILCYSPVSNKVYCAAMSKEEVKPRPPPAAALPASPQKEVFYPGIGEATPLDYADECMDPNQFGITPPTHLSSSMTRFLVAVIDGASNKLDTVVPTGEGAPYVLCPSTKSNRLYCANADNTVTVIDGTNNLMIASVKLGIGTPSALCYNSANNKVYCAVTPCGGVTIIGGADNRVDTTVNHWPNVNDAYALCYDSTTNKVYCADRDGMLGWIDGTRNQVWGGVALREVAQGEMDLGSDRAGSLCLTADGTIFCADEHEGKVRVPCFNCSYRGGIAVASGRRPRSLCYDPTDNKVYCANSADSTVTVIHLTK